MAPQVRPAASPAPVLERPAGLRRDVLDVALSCPVEIAWVMAGASQALLRMLGIPRAPLLILSEPTEVVVRLPWLARQRPAESPTFSVGLEGIEEEAVGIFLIEERQSLTSEGLGMAAYRLPHLDEGGYRPGLHAILRSQGSAVGHALAAAVALALAAETKGVIEDTSQHWLAALSGSTAHAPAAFSEALHSQQRYLSVADGAAALFARTPRRPGH